MNPRTAFPDPALAPADAPVAYGGDLRPERLLDAYRQGIFPWPDDHGPVRWWCPDPRAVLVPEGLHIAKSLRKRLRSGRYQVSADRAFPDVIAACAGPRRGQTGTWITPRLMEGYQALFNLGFAHSVEVWRAGALVGGLYGVSLGRIFFGESMFSHAPDASKVALAHLARQLVRWRFALIDCQVMTDHLARLGAVFLRRRDFLRVVRVNNAAPTMAGAWRLDAWDWGGRPAG